MYLWSYLKTNPTACQTDAQQSTSDKWPSDSTTGILVRPGKTPAESTEKHPEETSFAPFRRAINRRMLC
jgi:hypothetical protein